MPDFGESVKDAGAEAPELKGVNRIKAKKAELLAANKTSQQREQAAIAEKQARERAEIEAFMSRFFAERDGVFHLNEKLAAAAQELKKRLASENAADTQEFENAFETGEPLTVLTGVADRVIRKRMPLPGSLAKVDQGERDRYENDAVSEYRRLLEEDAKPLAQQKKKKPSFFEKPVPVHLGRLGEFKADAEEYGKANVRAVKGTAGFQELQSLYTLAGFRLEVETNGVVLEFKAHPIYAEDAEAPGKEEVAGKLENFGVSDEVAEKLRLQGAERSNTERLARETEERVAAEAAAKDRLIEELQARITAMPQEFENRLAADTARREREERIANENFERGVLVGRGLEPAERPKPKPDGAEVSE